jgi:hypothetical protein
MREPSGKSNTKWTDKCHFIHMTEDTTKTVTPTGARPAGDEATAAIHDEGAPSRNGTDMLPRLHMRLNAWDTAAPWRTAWILARDIQQRRQARDLLQRGVAQQCRATGRDLRHSNSSPMCPELPERTL